MNLKTIAARGIVIMIIGTTGATAMENDYPVKPVPFTKVQFKDTFWLPRMETNRNVTIPYDLKKCEETGRIDNFGKAAGFLEGEFEGIRFNDSDVFKVMEGAAYSLNLQDDPELDAYLDGLIEWIGAAQEEDGYLYTTRTIDAENPVSGAGDERWSYLRSSHELYNMGHMYEAVVAHYLATGKRSFLDIAIRNADLIDKVFGPNSRQDVPGHQEIEIGLVKLYRITGNERYLNLAKFFLDQRGRANDRELYGEYCQDHEPVTQQDEAVGHAVRACYMYSGMADVAALTGDPDYIEALGRIWENVISKKLYITGGVGARREGEAFDDAYVLPNKEAYNETCAAIANILWNHRLFLLHGDAKYIDVLERTLYNGFLVGVSLNGYEFFYPNPLESDGVFKFNQGALTRKPWFDCACCPTNVVRFVPSIGGYVYAQNDNNVYVNLFVTSEVSLDINGIPVTLTQETDYPWEGKIKVTVDPEIASEFTMHIRIPGWAQNRPVPSDLYRYFDTDSGEISLTVNGSKTPLNIADGFARIRRTWTAGDRIELNLPMPIRRVLSHENVEENRGKVALERGPIVYCAEWRDNHGHALNLVLPDDAPLKIRHRPNVLGGLSVIEGKAVALYKKGNSQIEKRQQGFVAIPYYAWSHRGPGEMAVWLARTPDRAKWAVD